MSRRSVPVWVILAMMLVGCAENENENEKEIPAGPVCPSFAAASEGLPVEGEWRSHPAVGDVNGDGLGDIAALARKGDGPAVFLGDGLGGWTESSEGLKLERGFSCGIGTRLVDLDRDGHVDLVAADHCAGVQVYRGNGGTSWKNESKGIPLNVEGFNDADVGDLNGDGILDIVAISGFGRGFLVLAGQADRSWKILHETGLPTTGMGFELQLVDVTGDGLLDVLSGFTPTVADRRKPIPPPARVWIQDSSGRFRPGKGFPEFGRFFGVATIEGRNAGRDDLLFGLIGKRMGLYRFESDSEEGWIEVDRLDEDWFEERSNGFVGVDTADFDADGCADIVATGGAGGGAWLAMGDCNGGFELCPKTTLPRTGTKRTGWGVTAADLNGDGRPDVVAAFGSHGAGGISAWIQDGD